MSEGEQLFLIVALLYLSGCLLWVNRRMIVFSSWFGGKWKAVVADYRWGNSKGSIWLQNPFPPLGFAFKCQVLPVSISPTHIVAYNVQMPSNSGRPRQSKKTAAITPETRFTRKGSVLWIDGHSFCGVGDFMIAHKLVVLLNKMKHFDEATRAKMIAEFWQERMRLRETKKMIRLVVNVCDPLRQFCSFIFFVLFAFAPMTAVRYSVGLSVLVGASVMILAAIIICIWYRVLHRRFYPAFKDGLGSDMVRMALCPPTALRVVDLVMGKLSSRLDALPLAILLLRGDERETFLKGYLADLQSPDVPDGLSAVVRETCLWQTKMMLKVSVTKLPRKLVAAFSI